MMSNSEIDKKVKATIESINSIEEVRVSPFLKDRILNQLQAKVSQSSPLFSWFTPQLQLSTLALFLILNVLAYLNVNSEDYNSSIDEFTETYGLVEEAETTFSNF